jgi:hypothetical protein
MRQPLIPYFQECNLLCHGARPAVLAPALLRSCLDTQQKFDKHVGNLIAGAQSQRRKSRIRCTCSRRNQPLFFERGIHQQPTTHDDACPFHNQNRAIIVLFRRWTFCSWILSFSIQASLTITKGAGGFSISPHLEFRAIVPVDSPVFRLLLDTQTDLMSQAARDVIENTQKKLLGLLQEGQGSYSDTLPDGDTILHVSKSCLT